MGLLDHLDVAQANRCFCGFQPRALLLQSITGGPAACFGCRAELVGALSALALPLVEYLFLVAAILLKSDGRPELTGGYF